MKKFFFATSMIKEYWSKESEIIFSGDWCFNHESNHLKLKANIVPYQWNDSKKVIKAQIYCEQLFNEILTKISNDLNKQLKLNNNSQYYRILLGNWLIHYIHQCYDKYITIKEAKKNKNIFTFYINKVENNIPYDFNEFIESSLKPEYQTRLFSELFFEMNLERRKLPSKYIKKQQVKVAKNSPLKLLKRLITNLKNNISYISLLFFIKFYKPAVIICNPYFKWGSLKNKLLLLIKSRGKIFFFNPMLLKNFSSKRIMYQFRSSKKKTSSTFNSIAYNLVKKNIPKVYLEYHHEYVTYVNRYYNLNDKISWLTFQWSGNTVFQYITALKHNKSEILLAQHGSGYGIDKIHSLEKNERAVSEKYFTYGWRENNKTIPLALPYISIKNKVKKNKNKILFLSTTRPTHLVRFHNGSNSSQNLIDNVKFPIIFLKNCLYGDYIIGRFHENDTNSWNNYERIKKEIPCLKKDQNKSFYKSLSEVKMMISDHLGTTFFECLQSNIPVVIFLNNNSYIFRNHGNIFIEKLLRNKILFFNPKEAALFVNKKYPYISSWWSSDKIQAVRKEILTMHFNTSKDWIDDWCKKLL